MHQIFSLDWWKMIFTVKYWRHRKYIHTEARARKVTGDSRPYWVIVLGLWKRDIMEEVSEEKKEHGGFG